MLTEEERRAYEIEREYFRNDELPSLHELLDPEDSLFADRIAIIEQLVAEFQVYGGLQ